MYKTFGRLATVIQIYSEAVEFDKNLKRALKCIDSNNNSSLVSQSGEQPQTTEYETFEQLNELLEREK